MLSRNHTAALGMMVFALFLGAGNVIFPPMAGHLAGEAWPIAALGFMLTGVGLPFLTLLTVAGRGRGEALSRDLPPWAATVFWSLLYLILGPLFAMPRVANVAYEMGWLPLGFAHSPWGSVLFALAFNGIGLYFMLKPGQMIDSVGRLMTPVLLLLLSAVALGVMLKPLSGVGATSASYVDGAFVEGLLSGYQTMDVLSAMAFGGLVARTLSGKGITQPKMVRFLTFKAGLISVALLSLLYLCLFYLGATSAPVAAGASNGGQILVRYVAWLFGDAGSWLMAGIVLLACLTTVVGLGSTCADYFAKQTGRLAYPYWLALISVASTLIANFGLDVLIRVTVPALYLIYPSAICLVLLQALRSRLPNLPLSYGLTLGVVSLISLGDALKAAGLLPPALQDDLEQLPLFSLSLGWLLPGLLALASSVMLGRMRWLASELPSRP
ncbi:branched-chain amino acid transport system II carrier protein [Chromobacterium sinusclupearum]|uniref:Branched-chain amino acid transport system carrier protein n=1 Tax=Chromobacterium sinusclupearum TaxID=2077146 RepID=A0A2K4MJ53_9NEIS|nr:branched-chain amino acid transport system II carrier protein [Chromobacterium sinusclupearum]POA97127.1 branched-chain amino acid transport system II carrier protein [Chromobacterium sinusclupearum]